MTDLSGAQWRTSSRSGTGECVEVADNLDDIVAVRDSKDQDGPVLSLDPDMWARFVRGVSRG